MGDARFSKNGRFRCGVKEEKPGAIGDVVGPKKTEGDYPPVSGGQGGFFVDAGRKRERIRKRAARKTREWCVIAVSKFLLHRYSRETDPCGSKSPA